MLPFLKVCEMMVVLNCCVDGGYGAFVTEMTETYVIEVLGGANVRFVSWAWVALRCLHLDA